MKVYKVIFARNAVLVCHTISSCAAFPGTYYYQQQHGNLIFALIKAATEEDALQVAGNILAEVNTAVWGNDFIM